MDTPKKVSLQTEVSMQILDVQLIKIFLDILLYVEQEQNEEKLKLEKQRLHG